MEDRTEWVGQFCWGRLRRRRSKRSESAPFSFPVVTVIEYFLGRPSRALDALLLIMASSSLLLYSVLQNQKVVTSFGCASDNTSTCTPLLSVTHGHTRSSTRVTCLEKSVAVQLRREERKINYAVRRGCCALTVAHRDHGAKRVKRRRASRVEAS